MRKRVIAGFLAITLVMGSAVLPNEAFENVIKSTGVSEASAATSDVQGFSFDVCSDGTYEIGSYNGNKTTVTIPSEYKGKKVTSIGYEAFSDNDKMTKVVIPNTIRSIASDVFTGCTKLATISVPDTLYYVGDGSFEDTLWYKNQADGVVYVGNVAYSYKGKMSENTKINIKDGTYLIADSAFSEFENISEVTIPNSVQYINLSAFSFCTGLKNIAIPNSVQEIGDSAFYGCTNLSEITYTDELISIGANAFGDTAWFKNQPDGMIYINSVAYKYKQSTSEKKTVTIKDGTTIVTPEAFGDCKNVTKVVLPNSIKIIDDNAFFNCSGLTSITIPKSVFYVGAYAFSGCSSLTSVTILAQLKDILDGTFSRCSKLKSIKLPSSVKTLGTFVFAGCTSLTDFEVPTGVSYLNSSLFMQCTALKNVKISSAVKTIEELTFIGCKSLASFSVSKDNSKFSSENGILYNKKKTKLICCPDAKTTAKINSSTTTIGDNAFINCTKIKSITIPKSVTRIGSSAFDKCKSLTSIVIPNTVKHIEEYAFSECTKLKKITMPSCIYDIGQNVFDNTAWYKSQKNGVIYLGKVAYAYKGKITKSTKVTIKNGTVRIAAEAFSFNSNLTTIKIPDSVVSIGDQAFYYTKWYDKQPNGAVYAGKVAYGFKGKYSKNYTLKLKDGTTGIADCAFLDDHNDTAYSINKVVIPDSVKYIGETAFLSCVRLKSVVIPTSVKTIRANAFGYYVKNSDNEPYSVIKGFKIGCVKGTAGETYAKNNKLSCTYLKAFSKATAKLSKTSYTYSGKAFKPAVTVKYGKVTLKNGTDYTVTYKNNKSAGKASVVIKGKGKYTGTKTLTFSIRPKKQTTKLTAANNAFKVTWKKDSQVTAYEIQYSLYSNLYGAKKVVASKKLTSKTIKGMNRTWYFVRVRAYKTVSGKKIYGAWSTVKYVLTW